MGIALRASGLALLAGLAGLALPAPAAQAGTCTPKTNLEAIVDDSYSMALSDPNDLRVHAMELLMDTQGNERRTLGAVEFGTDAKSLFGPGPIGVNAPAFKSALAAALLDDGGSTDYNDAFAAAAAHNPAATGRIFLTDGEHTDYAPYANGHVGGPPVYAIGLGALAGSPYSALLSRIAGETGGLYRRVADAGGLQAAMFDMNSAIRCQAPPKRYTDAFTGLRQSEARSLTLARGTRTALFALTWANPLDRFTIAGVRLVDSKRKLKLGRRRGATFTTVRVSGLMRGKLRFAVKPTRLADPGSEVDLTTQVSRSSGR
jgi:hypothetical protein